MTAEILTIGDELLIGQVINTNAAVIARMLNSIGIDVVRTMVVGDDKQAIMTALAGSFHERDLIIVTGGLGPTHDDITRDVLCEFFQTDLIPSAEVLEDIHTLIQKRNIPLTAATQSQALVPRAARVLRNRNGTAPGLLFQVFTHSLVALPGVPFEMENIMQESVLPIFAPQETQTTILHRTLNTTGIGESLLFEKLGNLPALLGDVKLASLPFTGGVRLRLSAYESTRATAESKIRQAESNIRTIAGEYIYGVDEETLPEAVGKLLKKNNLWLSVAESCTGGFIAHLITNTSGSSGYFERGLVTYSNQSKMDLLDVPADLLERFGAVSAEVAEAMARGARSRSGTGIGLSTTGIAGPTGGTPGKPVGLVFVGYSDNRQTFSLRFQFGDQRIRFKERTAHAVLNLLRKQLLKYGEV